MHVNCCYTFLLLLENIEIVFKIIIIITAIKIGHIFKSLSKPCMWVFIELYIINSVTFYTIFESC